MMYRDLLKEDEDSLLSLHRRAVSWIENSCDEASKKKSPRLVQLLDETEKKPFEQCAYDLYVLSTGSGFFSPLVGSRIKLEFNSLEELDLQLALRGF